MTDLFSIYENKHLLKNIDGRLGTDIELFIDQFNPKKMAKFNSKKAGPEKFPNYEVQKEISI